MSAHVYKKVELVGSSTESSDKAVENAISKAGESLKRMEWFEVQETRGHIEDGRVAHWQVVLKVGFRIDET
ncbi:MAG: dodecin domain-containing protein [Gammaproteobacteria bacterium]|nr:dodecin domain-containing protein [Gammaproteobacteria bacterium]